MAQWAVAGITKVFATWNDVCTHQWLNLNLVRVCSEQPKASSHGSDCKFCLNNKETKTARTTYLVNIAHVPISVATCCRNFFKLRSLFRSCYLYIIVNTYITQHNVIRTYTEKWEYDHDRNTYIKTSLPTYRTWYQTAKLCLCRYTSVCKFSSATKYISLSTLKYILLFPFCSW